MIKRSYLAFHDIGFAFLPQHNGKGYAREASRTMLEYVVDRCQRSAHTRHGDARESKKSIQLLQRLGLRFDEVLKKPMIHAVNSYTCIRFHVMSYSSIA